MIGRSSRAEVDSTQTLRKRPSNSSFDALSPAPVGTAQHEMANVTIGTTDRRVKRTVVRHPISGCASRTPRVTSMTQTTGTITA
jgi:hypothetical protein